MTNAPPLVRPFREISNRLSALEDGSQGENRASRDRLQIEAANDTQAIDAFLSEYDQSPGTHRVYARECERLVLWSHHTLGKPISSLSRQDFEAYLGFLMDPQPAAMWCGPKVRRDKPEWRPFVGPLEESAVFTAISALNSLMTYLVDAGYLMGNPLGLIRQRRRKMKAIGAVPGQSSKTQTQRGAVSDEAQKVERYLDEEMWEAVTAAVETLQGDGDAKALADYERARFVFSFLYLLAPRVHEMETHTMNCFQEHRGRWWWHVVGKGAKAAKVPVPDDMVQALVRYRTSLGLSPMPNRRDDSPLLRSTRFPGRGITARWLNMLLKDVFVKACDHLPAESAWKSEKLRMASAHWGRHTGITAKVDAGMQERNVQKDARHKDRRTTERYIHGEDEAWHDDAQKQRLKWQADGQAA